MTVSATGVFYKEPNQAGESMYIYLTENDRYTHENGKNLQDDGFYGQINSARLFSSSVRDTSLTFFWEDQFNGPFVQLTRPKGSVQGDIWVTGAVHSYLLTGTANGGAKEVRLSYRDLFFQDWIAMIDQMKGDSIRRDFDPILTWEMFPADPRYTALDPNLTYLKVHQDLMALVPWPYTDYHIWMEYWIYLYPTGNGIRCTVPQYGWYVDGGALHDNVRDRFVWRVRDGAATLRDRVNAKLAQFDGMAPGGIHDIYYLPGKQPQPPTDTVRGHTHDDVTVVVAIN
ncbi:hypothetical protein [Actinomadura rubrisoli]|uniref:Uncharacterized protein n=1 Tax=Actinomadura rubrisoli TaxID=2530368 RepID=A0A4R5AY64_9ACTN|nr:hypothetical protein [Actinomadura rubrisoli]TDD76174.1 hypothetical protein E1298_30975 [Actinomadura rubrisoli]